MKSSYLIVVVVASLALLLPRLGRAQVILHPADLAFTAQEDLYKMELLLGKLEEPPHSETPFQAGATVPAGQAGDQQVILADRALSWNRIHHILLNKFKFTIKNYNI